MTVFAVVGFCCRWEVTVLPVLRCEFGSDAVEQLFGRYDVAAIDSVGKSLAA